MNIMPQMLSIKLSTIEPRNIPSRQNVIAFNALQVAVNVQFCEFNILSSIQSIYANFTHAWNVSLYDFPNSKPLNTKYKTYYLSCYLHGGLMWK